MKKFSSPTHATLNELNITPLLDLAFVLLVIFIITTPQLVNNLELNLPTAKVPPVQAKQPALPHQLVVSNTGAVSLNGQAVELSALRGVLAALKEREPEVSLVVRGASDADYRHVVVVLDVVQQLGITRVGLATVTAAKP